MTLLAVCLFCTWSNRVLAFQVFRSFRPFRVYRDLTASAHTRNAKTLYGFRCKIVSKMITIFYVNATFVVIQVYAFFWFINRAAAIQLPSVPRPARVPESFKKSLPESKNITKRFSSGRVQLCTLWPAYLPRTAWAYWLVG